jgi:hypothetical protein
MTTFDKFLYGFMLICALTFAAYMIWKEVTEKAKNRKSLKSANWKVGDKLTITSIKYRADLKVHNQNYAILRGWTESNLFIEIGDAVYKTDWDILDVNKSALWRQNYDECKAYMGTEPGFSSEIDDNDVAVKLNSDEMIDGVPIECLSETLCEVHLTKAIKEENFRLAALLRKRMESFR